MPLATGSLARVIGPLLGWRGSIARERDESKGHGPGRHAFCAWPCDGYGQPAAWLADSQNTAPAAGKRRSPGGVAPKSPSVWPSGPARHDAAGPRCHRRASGPSECRSALSIRTSRDARRLVPLIVAVALFMENMDSTVIATSLPAIAADIGTNPLALKLAITSYLLSLAIFIPGQRLDRRPVRRAHRVPRRHRGVRARLDRLRAVGLAHPVRDRAHRAGHGRRHDDPGRPAGAGAQHRARRELVDAMAWVTTPALIGPVIGPPLGGFITTYATWHWIFLINVPIGLIGIVLATGATSSTIRARGPRALRHRRHRARRARHRRRSPSDSPSLGLNLLPWSVVAALIVGGAVSIAALLRARAAHRHRRCSI